eukprot:CAMPEP_0185011890 /NCGR_PEP_ID=MMETSP1098-20130426/98024_1 /TAXON_ID=89044 /ORGANISM="Spumella elongata, Strain CCAP 955/1" /LENGTH=694 /DNA_ID=CAMNT_0027540937 /DNA_START=216 /DNA_END=2300 /DNA_ORIENTATION=+
MRTDSSDIELRKGKWTVEEENYANKIISLFNQGMLPVVAGTTLRTYLSDKLRCDPMRITKKYAGASCIGKQVFQLCDNYYECFQENERELQRLENLFLVRINGKGGGLSSKRGIADVPPVPHQSIYETSNLDPSATATTVPTNYNPTIHLASASKRPYKTNRRGSGSKSGEKNQNQFGLNLTMALGGSPQLVNHRHSHSATDSHTSHHQAHFSHYDAYRSGSDYEDQSCEDDYYEHSGEDRTSDARQEAAGDDGEGQEDDYGYVYDPDCDADSVVGHAQQQRMLRQYQQQQQQQQNLPSTGSPAAAAATKSGFYSSFQAGGRRVLSAPNLTELNLSNWKDTAGFYSSFQAGGRRVLSAPNLTELNLSNWKDTAYRPLPADSLKEMFSLPLGAPHHLTAGGMTGTGIAGAGYDAYGMHAGNASLLPDHVYSAMGNESGRYAKSNGSGRSKAANGNVGGGNSNGSAAAVMAARAKATMLALQRHRQEQQQRPPQHFSLGEGRAMDDTHTLRHAGAPVMGGSPKPRMKRSHSAMALVDFEKLAGDDTAAGDLFLQFLNKVSGTSNTTTPRIEPKMEDSAISAVPNGSKGESSIGLSASATTEGLVKEEMAQCGDVRSIAHSTDFDTKPSRSDSPHVVVVVVLPSIPATLLPTDADLILPCSAGSAACNTDTASTITSTTITATTTEESLDGGAMDLS